MGKRKTQNLQVEIEFFDKVATEYGHFDTMAEEVYSEIFDNINSYIGNDVLDAGCGTGAFGRRIKDRALNRAITGVDINQNFIDLARNTFSYNDLICANLEDRKIFKASNFDTIICPYILHHFPEMKDVVDNFYYWLKPGGFLVIVDPNGSNLILRASYILRLILSKFIDTQNYASVNESHKHVYEFKKCLKEYEIFEFKTFENRSDFKIKLFPFSLINFLGFIQKVLLKLYNLNPLVRFSGSDLIIIAKKMNKNDMINRVNKSNFRKGINASRNTK